jgi:hypothetical protein
MANKHLTPEQTIAIKWLAQPKHGGKTHEEIAEICGVHRTTLFNWKKSDLFLRELKKEMVRSTLNRMPEVLESIPDHIIKEGNAAMLKTFLQMNDMLTETHVVTDGNDKGDIDDLRSKIEAYKNKGKSEDE